MNNYIIAIKFNSFALRPPLSPASWYKTASASSNKYEYCQAQVRSPKVQSPKVKTKGTWADTKITRVWITSSTGCITSSTKEYNLLHREYNLLHHPPLTQMNCITSSTTHLQLKWIVQPPQWWLSLQPPPPPTPWALTLHFTPQNLRVYNLLNHSTDCLNSSIECATTQLSTHPKSNLIKDKILVLGLDIVEHKVYYYFVTSDMTQCCTQFALYALQLRWLSEPELEQKVGL